MPNQRGNTVQAQDRWGDIHDRRGKHDNLKTEAGQETTRGKWDSMLNKYP